MGLEQLLPSLANANSQPKPAVWFSNVPKAGSDNVKTIHFPVWFEIRLDGIRGENQ
jgi:hypothetical protein